MKIITGNPGTGKHTIARRIAEKMDLDLVDVNKVAIDKGVFSRSNGILDVDTAKLRKSIDKMASANSVLVGHLAPYVISPGNVKTVVVLRRSPYKLQSTYRRRGYTRKKSLENLGSEILGVIYSDAVHQFGQKKVFQVDTTNMTVPSTARKVESIFNGSKKGDNVDWLQTVLKKGDMRKFFPY